MKKIERKEREKERKGGRKERKVSSYYTNTIATLYLELQTLNCPLYDVKKYCNNNIIIYSTYKQKTHNIINI